MPDASTVLASGGLSAALFAILWSIFSTRLKAAIEHEYAIKEQKFKNETQKELARLNAELERVTSEHSFRFSRVFEKTADTIANTYKLLLALRDAVELYTMPMNPEDKQTLEKLHLDVRQKTVEFLEYYRPNRIYIKTSTAEKIRGVFNALSSMKSNFEMSSVLARQYPNSLALERMDNRLAELSDALPGLLSALEDEFQETLGLPVVITPEKPAQQNRA